jgi:hypothetical protein
MVALGKHGHRNGCGVQPAVRTRIGIGEQRLD